MATAKKKTTTTKSKKVESGKGLSKTIDTAKSKKVLSGKAVTYGNEENVTVLEKCVEKNLPVLLVGETGTGKTTMVKSLAQEKGKKLVRLNMNGQIGREEFVGKYVLEDNATVWQDGPLITAMKNGYWLLVDELNVALPEILFVMQSLLESNNGKLGNVMLSEKDGEIVEPHADFRVFATCNPPDNYVGTKDLNIATLSRFIVINIHWLDEVKERRLLNDRFTTLDEADVFQLVSLSSLLRAGFSDKSINYFCSTRDLVNVCMLLEAGLEKSLAVKTCIVDKILDEFDKKKVKEIIKEVMSIEYEDILHMKSEVERALQTLEENKKLKSAQRKLKGEVRKLNDKIKINEEKVNAFDDLKKKFEEMKKIYEEKM